MRVRVGLRSVLGVVAFAASLAAPGAARADGARVRLTYTRGEGATSCPDARAFGAAVAGRLGYEPFDPTAARKVNVTLGRRDRAFEARIEMIDSGAPPAERRFTSRASDCAELAATTELALAIAIDPFRAAAPAPPPVAPAPPSAAPAAPVDVAPALAPVAIVAAPVTPASPRQAVIFQAAGALVGAVGAAPAAALGLEVGIGARRGDLSLAIEGRADLPASTPLPAAEVSAWLLAGSLVPCAHWRAFAGCVLATAGVLRAAGRGLVDARQVTVPWLALGARLGADLPLSASLSLSAHADAVAPLVQTELRVGDAVVWTTPAVVFAVAVGLAFAFR